MSTRAVLRLPGEGKSITLGGQPMAFLVTGEDSKHTCMFDWSVPPGFFTGLHVHRVQEETFYVLEGECEWQIGDQVVAPSREHTCSSRREFPTISATPPTRRPGC